MNDKPNLIERLENLVHALHEAREANTSDEVESRISDADGIAGEILTMIDGR